MIPIGILVVGLSVLVDGAVSAWKRWRQPSTVPWDRAASRVRIRTGLIATATLVGVIAVILVSARAWQQRNVTTLVSSTLGVNWETVSTVSEKLGDIDEYWYAPHLAKW